MRNKALLLAGLLAVVFFSSGFIQDHWPVGYSSYEELSSAMGSSTIEGLPEGENSLFAGSGKCGGCHGFDPLGIAGVDEDGNDVNLVDDWRASMMANSAKDPFWRAKVSHEVTINPAHQEALEDKCLSCHAPLARHAAHYDGAESYSFAEMLEDSLALDGVSCGACHQQSPESVGTQFSGEMEFDTDTIYGPYGDGEDADIFASPMEGLVGFTPLYGEHIEKSESCAACHTLITNTVDLDGEFTGGTFVEQATYHEWVNSAYANDLEQECQACHLPRIEDAVVLSTNYIFLEGRSPFGLHTMLGGNSFMLEMMKNHIDDIGAAASEEQFQKAIDGTIYQLQNESVEIELTEIEILNDTAHYQVSLTNLTGHKFPSGYPARRAYIEFVATDDSGDIVFKSGVMDDMYEVEGQDPTYESHYDVITNTEQVQIYELVMGDVNGDVTTVLERADHPLKDNRLVPLGFSYTHENYDTVQVAGLALDDDNFNNNGTVGSGTDWVDYRFPLNGFEGDLSVEVKLFYQSAPPKWNEELFAVSTPMIDQFEEWYWEQGPSPVEVDQASMISNTVGVAELFESDWMVFPNPSTDGQIQVSYPGHVIDEISVYTADGRLVYNESPRVSARYQVNLPDHKGLYFIQLRSGQSVGMKKVIRR